MECVLQQGSFRGLGLKLSSPQQLLFWQETVDGQNGDVSSSAGDDSFVDQLLNLNSENTQEDVDDHTQLNDKNSALLSFPPPLQPISTAGEDDFGSLLTLPEEEADLEWLSHFVEDSFAQFNHATGATANPMPETQEPPSPFSPPAVLPRSRRSKRLRPAFPAAVRVWARPSPPPISLSLTESTTSSSPSSSATSSPHWPTSPSTPLAFPNPNPKEKKGRAGPGGEYRPGSSSVSSRRCSHCGTQKTPQWRAGPMGSKTLCNACGVRFKTGRLLPEYRPACSPTFSSELHSNSHRKVLEMRMKKETTGQTEPGFVLADPNCG